MNLTASSLSRAMRCVASAALPHTPYLTVEGEQGTERHSVLEERARSGDFPAAVYALLLEAKCHTIVPEAKFAYDVATDTARKIEHPGHRNYGTLAPYEIAMQGDLVGYGPECVVVVDYKGYERVEPAERNKQLAALAIAACRVSGVERAIVAIAYPQADEPDGFEIDRAELSSLDHDLFRLDMQGLLKDVVRARRNPAAYVSESSDCRYCGAFLHCPAKKALLANVQVGATETRVEMILPLGDDQSAADAYDLAKKLELLTKRINAAVYARANTAPIPLNNGKVLGPTEVLGDTEIDADIAYAVVREKHGQEAADLAVKREATQAGIERALKPRAGKGELAGMKREVMDEIKKRGGAKRPTEIKVREYQPEPQPRLKAGNG